MAENKKFYYVRAEEKVILERAPQKFPALNKPDTGKFALGKCKDGVYKTTALYKADSPFIKKLTAKLDALYEKGVAEVAKVGATMPTATKKDRDAKEAFLKIQEKNPYFKADTDKEGNETGYVAVNVKLNVTDAKGNRKSFTMIDAKKNPMSRTVEIWGGTEAVIQANAKFYNLAGPKQSGISLELLAIQIVNLVGPTGGGGNRATADLGAFEETDGYETTEDSGEQTSSSNTSSDPAGEDEPF